MVKALKSLIFSNNVSVSSWLCHQEVLPHKPWLYIDLDGTQQIGGFTRKFEGLTYLTVKVSTDTQHKCIKYFQYRQSVHCYGYVTFVYYFKSN